MFPALALVKPLNTAIKDIVRINFLICSGSCVGVVTFLKDKENIFAERRL
jgi:hypothetical protein